MTLFHSLLRRSLRLAPFKLPNRHRYNNKYNNNCSNNNINQHSPFSTDPSRSNNAGQLAFDKSASDPHNIPPAVTMATVLSHAGVKLGEYNAPMSPPLHLASTYTRPPNGIYGNTDSIYSRSDNPTRLQLEDVVRQLETHGDERLTTDGAITTTTTSCAFASGMAAVSSLVLAHQVPLTVLLPKDLYHGVSTVMIDVFDRFQVTVMRVDMRDEPAMKQALLDVSTPHAIVWMETPSNPMCHVVDIERLCQLVRETSSLSEFTTVVDSTLCPPCLTQPLRLGVDANLHSGTKYMGGHSDLLLGLVTTSPWTERGRALGIRLKQVQYAVGAVASPFDSWLTLRGLRTLHVRVERACQTALEVARYLSTHPFVHCVHYPGLPAHPQHDIAARQMKKGQFGGVLSFELVTEDQAMAVAGALQTVQRATSLGGTETLVEHRASIEPPGRVTSPPGLLRVSIGLEDASDVIQDFARALAIAEEVTK